MASTTLYPPIIDAYMPAFIGDTGDNNSYCRLYFSMSEYSSSIQSIESTHISIIKQSSGQSAVRKIDNVSAGRYRSTGIIIINSAPIRDLSKDNLYYIDILNEDVQKGDATGWQIGWLYKVQVRFSTVAYDETTGQAAWLNSHATDFSEWSTFCVIKAIGTPEITIPILNNSTLDLSTLEVVGDYSNSDNSETLYSYNFKLYQNNNLLEESEELYTNQYRSPNQFSYLFKYELQDDTSYVIEFNYITLNKYTDTEIYNITISQSVGSLTNVRLVTIETVNDLSDTTFINDFNSLTFKESEEEEGRVGLKLYLQNNSPQNKKFYIRRSCSKDNFTTWYDIKYIECTNQIINDLPMIYDYTIESGVWYKYGIQEYDSSTEIRGALNIMNKPVLRDFIFSFIIGEGGKQLKLKFDNTMNSYMYNYSEGSQTTIGGKYPFIARNGNTEYRTFPVNGLISFNMDENQLFTDMLDLYKYSDVVTLYNNRRRNEHIDMYDYTLERDFREKVLKFLQDGKPKLFKSASEGNIIVRLTQVNPAPNQSLNRMIYSFSSTANEIADATMENYKKFGFYRV